MIRLEEPEPEIKVPRGVLIAAGLLILFAITVAGVARHTGYGQLRAESADVHSAVAFRDLRFVDRSDGAVEVFDASDGSRVHRIEPGTNGFIRGSMRGLARERRRRGLDPEIPFRVAVWPNGQTTLEDLATGTIVDLFAFGRDNAAAFSALVVPEPLPLTTQR